MSARPQRRWDDVAEGEVLEGFSLELNMTRTALQVSGTQDFYPINDDRAFARSAGHRDIFVNTGFIRACLCRVLTDWIGPDGFLKRLAFQMRTPTLLGETISARGRVKQKGPDGRVEIDVWIESAPQGITVPGSATVILPVRR